MGVIQLYTFAFDLPCVFLDKISSPDCDKAIYMPIYCMTLILMHTEVASSK